MDFPEGLAMLRNHCLLALLGSSRTTTSHTLLQGASPQSSCSHFTDEGTEAQGCTCSPDHAAGSWLAELVPLPPWEFKPVLVYPSHPAQRARRHAGVPLSGSPAGVLPGRVSRKSLELDLSILSSPRSRAGHRRGRRTQAVCNADRASASELPRHGHVCGIPGAAGPACRAVGL